MTIIYYTSNRERPEFEEKLRDNLPKDFPIVSVSQKPIDLGKNICVGDVGTSGFNALRQILIACENAKTKFVVSAEADCLYPPDYFKFIPQEDGCYRSLDTYIVGINRDYFYKKREGGIWAQVINREWYIKRLKELFKGEKMWDTEQKNFPKEKGEQLFTKFKYFNTNPCISFKTGRGMRHYSHSERVPIYKLPYWGSSKSLISKYENIGRS